MRFSRFSMMAAATCLAASPVMAQDDGASAPKASGTVTATNAASVMTALQAAGYEGLEYQPASGPDDVAIIELVWQDIPSFIAFEDCQEAIPEYCETLVLSTAWDRDTPISDKAIAEANYEFRYISVWKDEEGDPFAQWAILTGQEGIPTRVFLDAVLRYLEVVHDFSTIAFDGDEDGDDDGDEGSEPAQEPGS